MKNKGFTLVEILGVLILLSVLSLIVSQIIINRIKENQDKLEELAKEVIISSARDYVYNNSSSFEKINQTQYCISYATLNASKYLNEEMIPNLDNVEYLKDYFIKVTYNGVLFEYEMVDTCSVVYTLTVSANGGIWSGTSPQTITSGETVTINNPTRTNYLFAGWTVSGTGSSIDGTTFTMGTSNATLTANWTVNSYTLTVNANGGTWSGTTPQTIAVGGTSTISNPTKGFDMFVGWTVSCTGCSMVGTTFTMGTSNATLTASYTPMIAYTGTYTFVDQGSGNWYVSFLTSGTLTVTGLTQTIDALVVGGGGSAGHNNNDTGGAGGGGAGGVVYSTNISLANGTHTVTVGAGGTQVTAINTKGNNGENSVFNGITAYGGGAGGGYSSPAGSSGGSGGGGSYPGGVGGTASQGYAGGNARNATGNGGGGAGGGCDPYATYGGAAISNSITGTAVFYAQGGSGGESAKAPVTASYKGSGGGAAYALETPSYAGIIGIVIIRNHR